MENKEIKQSSVEWLYEQMLMTDQKKWFTLMQIAKEYHRTEIIEAFWHGRHKSDPKISMDYYDEKFGKLEYFDKEEL